jgi:EAL domain-containing protein (putative c-di-GMP-specific phosphodiesterase class I)
MNVPVVGRLGARRGAFGVRLDRPEQTVLAAALVLTLASCLLELLNFRNGWLFFEDFGCSLAPAAGALAVAIAAVRGDREHSRLRWSIALALGFAAVGQILRVVPDAIPGVGSPALRIAADGFNVIGGLLGMSTLMRALGRRLEPEARRAVLLEGLIIMVAGVGLVMVNWLTLTTLSGPEGTPIFADPASNLLTPMVAASFFASAAAATIAALALRIEPVPRGVWAVTAGVALIALAWVGWSGRFLSGAPDSVEPMDVIFPIGALVTAYGGLTWSLRRSDGRLYGRIAAATVDWLPMAAIVGCAILDVMPRKRPLEVDPIAGAMCVVILLAVVRQRILQGRERVATDRLTSEKTERAATAASLARLEAGTSVEETAERICAEALRIDGIDTVTVMAFTPSAVVPLAQGGWSSGAVAVGEPIPSDAGRELKEHAGSGPWLESWTDRMPRHDYDRAVTASGRKAEALAPLIWNDETIGLLAMGTTSALNARHMADRLPALAEFSVMSARVLGPMLAEQSERERRRSEIQLVIDSRAFWPVFQPIVELSTGESVGYEALTRFADGKRPDLCFLAADEVGMMARLETACLHEQIALARNLPRGGFLSLNASPALAVELTSLMEAIRGADRPVVVEITEHVQIEDYARLLAALDQVRDVAQLSVDDAGAGYAGLRHILELRPKFVKLDISLVSGVDSDTARQAMIAGMTHFAESVGCDLVAEGIETADELAALRLLGVRYGQGYFLGKPARAPQNAEVMPGPSGVKGIGATALDRPARPRRRSIARPSVRLPSRPAPQAGT